MGYYEKLLKLNRIEEAMLDEKSKILFSARIDYMITRDADRFYDMADALGDNWFCEEVNEALDKFDFKGIIVFGCGHDGKRTKKILDYCNLSPEYFCDSDVNKVGKLIESLEVLSVENVVKNYRDYLIILGSTVYAKEMYYLLLSKKISAEKILYPKYGTIVAQCGKQYFDIFLPKKDEVFIDGGSYNGETIIDFINWTNREYKKVYVFEPLENMSKNIEEWSKRERIDGIEIHKNALWDKKENLNFLENKAGSSIRDTGKIIVRGISLDEVVKDEKITFIKLDVEGSELRALEGARNTIIKNKPRLAICIYHKPEDIIELPVYILKLVPEYKFYIRHYSSCMWETVLYAEI